MAPEMLPVAAEKVRVNRKVAIWVVFRNLATFATFAGLSVRRDL